MRRPYQPKGYMVTTFWDHDRKVECDTFTCQHCNRVVPVRPLQRAEDVGRRCTCCDGLICMACTNKPCTPLEKRREQWAASYHARRSYGL
jgi:hypothetical protein